MTPFECFMCYHAVKLHFTSTNYDYFKYNGKTKATLEAFEKRKDIGHFRWLSNFYDPLGLLVAHLVKNPSTWVGEISGNLKPYHERRAIIDTMDYTFRQETKNLKINVEVSIQPNQHPLLLQKWLGDKISLETFAIILDITNCQIKWKSVYQDDPAMKLIERAEKYIAFIKHFMGKAYERDKFVRAISF